MSFSCPPITPVGGKRRGQAFPPVSPLVIPAGLPLPFPPVPPLSFPPVPLLSFPPVFSGNPWSFFCPFICVSPAWRKNLGFPIKNVGNDTERDVGHSLLSFPPFPLLSPDYSRRGQAFPPVPLCHSRPPPLVIPAGILSYHPHQSPSCHPRHPPLLSFPLVSLLSFPPVVSGNPVFD